jgi:alpha-tubulin suppressor-like RCC1 family protein
MQIGKSLQGTAPPSITFSPDNYTTRQYMSASAVNDEIIEGTHYFHLRSKGMSSDPKYNNKYTGAYDQRIVDNGTGRQPRNQISGGNYFVLAVDGLYTGDRKLYAWGDDTCGQASGLTAESYGYCDYNQDNLSQVSNAGSGQLIPRTAQNSYVIDNSSVGDNSSNTPIYTGIQDVYKVVSRTSNSCVLFDNRTAVQCWGRARMNNHPHTSANNWTRQNSFLANDIDIGYEHVAMALDNGSVVTWGYGRNGALGNGARDYANDGSVILSNVKDLATGGHHSCFLFNDGTVSCTGKDERKQIGVTTDTSNGCGSEPCVTSPTPIEGGFNTFTQIDAGSRFTVGLLDNGSLVCWGNNDSGQCGMGSVSTQVNPPAISTTAPTGIVKVWADGSKTCVATNKYKDLYCSGSFYIGDGSSTDQSSFVKVDMPSAHNPSINGDRIVDVAMTSGGICVYTEYLTNMFNGDHYIFEDVFCSGSYEPAVGAGTQAMPVRTPVQLGTPF